MTGAYSYQISTPPIPPDVTAMTAVQVGDTAVLRWADSDDISVEGYDLTYSLAVNTSDDAFPLSLLARATEITTTNIPPGEWKVYIVARNTSGDVSSTPFTANLSMNNQNAVVATQSYIPCYHTPNPDSSFSVFNPGFMHWTGKFIPKSANLASSYVEVSAPDINNFQLDYVPGGNFDDTTYYFQVTFVTQSGETLASAEASIFVPAGNLPTIFYDGATYGYHFWNVYLSDSSGGETKQNADVMGLKYNLQIWQMPITGILSGDALPTKNTTGWDVFNLFVPDSVNQYYFVPDAGGLDLGSAGSYRAWLSIDLLPGPGEPPLEQRDWSQTFHILSSDTSPVPLVSGDTMSVIGRVGGRYVMPYIVLQSTQNLTADGVRNGGSVCYINSLTLTVDQ